MSKSLVGHRTLYATIIIAALGYFVDIYDLLLFSIVRVKSLRAIGVPEDQLLNIGGSLISYQMWGMLIGGALWGILGDKRGRLSVLFGSILIYSIANIANGFVNDVATYQWLRFFAGLGLAGELGAGITLVSEMMPREKRGYGTTTVATVGILGAIVAYFVSLYWDWRTAYFVGGAMGLALLMLRVTVFESGLFNNLKETNIQRGQFLSLFTDPSKLRRYALAILIGTPTWFVMGILVTFSKEFSEQLGVEDIADPGRAVMWAYLGLTFGDLSSGLISQWLRSRKKAMLIFHLLSAVSIILYLSTSGGTLSSFYTKILFMGFGVGYWAVFVTIASEQFGTNLRATVATSVPNFARGMLPLIIMAFTTLRQTTNGIVGAAVILGCITVAIALVSLYFLPETFGKDLDYNE